jgi:hypothetical protein
VQREFCVVCSGSVMLARGPAVQSPKRRKTGHARQANEECTRAYRPKPYPAAGCCNARTVNRPASTRRRADRREHRLVRWATADRARRTAYQRRRGRCPRSGARGRPLDELVEVSEAARFERPLMERPRRADRP